MELDEILQRGVAEIVPEMEFRRKLASGRPLRLKQGFDPSRSDIHLGHAVGLRKLRQLQELGHEVILIVGDWTAQIGDPSGRDATRPMLTADEVRANAQTFLDQFFKIVHRDRAQVVWQREWYGKFGLADLIKLTSKFTVAQLLAHETFRNRLDSGIPVSLTELIYPLLQAYDSVQIRADVEFGGTDQKFNCLLGRELQVIEGQEPQDVFLVPILVGTDGSQKMSKSLGNYVGIDEPPYDMYGKIMSIPDELMQVYFELLTDVPLGEVTGFAGNPMELKHRLAWEIVSQFHSPEAARSGAEEWKRVHQKRELPTEAAREFPYDAEKYPPTLNGLSQLLVDSKLVPSKAEASRKVKQGGVRVNLEKVQPEQAEVPLEAGATVSVGRHAHIRLV